MVCLDPLYFFLDIVHILAQIPYGLLDVADPPSQFTRLCVWKSRHVCLESIVRIDFILTAINIVLLCFCTPRIFAFSILHKLYKGRNVAPDDVIVEGDDAEGRKFNEFFTKQVPRWRD
jgi:hypothetical protein